MTVLEAIGKIAYSGRRFPGKELQFVLDHWEEARPYLRGIIEKATEKPEEVDEEESILIPALMLLGEKEDREFFPQLVRFVSLDSECLEMMLGDLITEDLKDVLYSLYNGDLELVKESARNTDINEYVRTDFMEVMGQLYMDGKLEEQELKDFIREGIHSGEESDIIYNTLLQLIEGNHFVDMLCEVRYMYDNELITEFFMGGYDSAVDECYMYTDKPFCRTPIRTIERLSKWAMYDSAGQPEINLGKAIQELKKMEQPARTEKIGRNDPCPCGSGKKYKNCCMKKQAAEEAEAGVNSIESRAEQEKALRDYPYLGDERVEGRVYLDDTYDAQAIEIDRLLYLGLMHRPELIWNRNLQKEEERKRAYLELAFGKFQEKVAMEDIHTLEAYDEKFSIHYRCREWLEELLDITDENTARKIRQMIRKMK